MPSVAMAFKKAVQVYVQQSARSFAALLRASCKSSSCRW